MLAQKKIVGVAESPCICVMQIMVDGVFTAPRTMQVLSIYSTRSGHCAIPLCSCVSQGDNVGNRNDIYLNVKELQHVRLKLPQKRATFRWVCFVQSERTHTLFGPHIHSHSLVRSRTHSRRKATVVLMLFSQIENCTKIARTQTVRMCHKRIQPTDLNSATDTRTRHTHTLYRCCATVVSFAHSSDERKQSLFRVHRREATICTIAANQVKLYTRQAFVLIFFFHHVNLTMAFEDDRNFHSANSVFPILNMECHAKLYFECFSDNKRTKCHRINAYFWYRVDSISIWCRTKDENERWPPIERA